MIQFLLRPKGALLAVFIDPDAARQRMVELAAEQGVL